MSESPTAFPMLPNVLLEQLREEAVAMLDEYLHDLPYRYANTVVPTLQSFRNLAGGMQVQWCVSGSRLADTLLLRGHCIETVWRSEVQHCLRGMSFRLPEVLQASAFVLFGNPTTTIGHIIVDGMPHIAMRLRLEYVTMDAAARQVVPVAAASPVLQRLATRVVQLDT